MHRLVPVLALLALAGCDMFLPRPRPKSHECRSNLKGWYTGQRAFLQEKDRYSTSMSEVGFSPERGNRYLYVDALPGSLTDRSGPTETRGRGDTGILPDVYKLGPKAAVPPSAVPLILAGNVPLGLSGKCPENCQISAVCVAQLDDDPTFDIWSISTAPRKLPGGELIYEGQPFLESNDMAD